MSGTMLDVSNVPSHLSLIPQGGSIIDPLLQMWTLRHEEII